MYPTRMMHITILGMNPVFRDWVKMTFKVEAILSANSLSTRAGILSEPGAFLYLMTRISLVPNNRYRYIIHNRVQKVITTWQVSEIFLGEDRLELSVKSLSLVLRIVNDSVIYIEGSNTMLVFMNIHKILPNFFPVYITITREQFVLICVMGFTNSISCFVLYWVDLGPGLLSLKMLGSFV